MHAFLDPVPLLPANDLPKDVRVWRARLDRAESGLDALLSEDERLRADRLLVAAARSRFVVSRGLLRWALGGALDVDPAAVQFTYGTQGKPALADHSLRFNLAHSADLWVLAVSPERDVGVDVEMVRSVDNQEEMERMILTQGERAGLADHSPDLRSRAFLQVWTRKEAALKALGLGLQMPLDSFDVSDPRRASIDIALPLGASKIRLLDLDLGPEAVGALALVPDGV